MVWILNDYQLVFYHVPRTAGNSIRESLSKGGIELEGYGGLSNLFEKSIDWNVEHNIEIPEHARGYTSFSVVRNPFARELSFYYWMRQQAVCKGPVPVLASIADYFTFLKFKSSVEFKSEILNRFHGIQSRFLKDLKIDIILRFETLSKDWQTFSKGYLGKEIPLVHWKPTANPVPAESRIRMEYRKLKVINELVRYAEEDFEKFKYSKNLKDCRHESYPSRRRLHRYPRYNPFIQ